MLAVAPEIRDQPLMAWPKPQFSRADVNSAGRILSEKKPDAERFLWALDVLTNWRACHGYPINTFQATMRTRLLKDFSGALVAQRLKRTPSIIGKLRRFPTMPLSTMQDIGGLRAVVNTITDAKRLRDSYIRSQFKHELVREKDYIECPKTDGYRSIHLVYRYANDAKPAVPYAGLKIELQIRTKLQHAWATAVETMGTFLGQALKSRQGERKWLQFFEITGAAFACLEHSPLVPGYATFTKQEIFLQLREAERELGVLDMLRGFAVAAQRIEGKGHYNLIVLDSQARSVVVTPYSFVRLAEAVEAYTAVEVRADKGEPIEAVLVAAGTIVNLRKAYPNYFLDTQDFVKRVRSIIGTLPRRISGR